MDISANVKIRRLQLWASEFVCRNRRNRVCHFIGQLSYLVWRAYENRNFEMKTNGEEWILKTYSSLNGIQCIFDVGANIGEWLIVCRKHIPDAPIHAFEIAPKIFSELQRNTSNLIGLTLNPTGLSDQNNEITIYFSEAASCLTTAYRENLGAAFDLPGESESYSVKSLKVPVICGDDYVGKHDIKKIDVLKIDVEGMEECVLRGFQKMFIERRIRLVQFEYNNTNIVSKFMLRDAYDFFAKFGYKIGKLYPNYVEFRDYHYRQEDFCGPNMVAVHKDDLELLKLLNPKIK